MKSGKKKKKQQQIWKYCFYLIKTATMSLCKSDDVLVLTTALCFFLFLYDIRKWLRCKFILLHHCHITTFICFYFLLHLKQDTRETFDERFQSSAFSIHDSSTSSIKQCEYPNIHPDVALFNEFNTTGSLCSIHSAPQVQLTDSINVMSEIITVPNDTGNGLLQQNLSTKSVFLELIGNKRTSEIDEDDNDNLLTVSSVTARPLIAKSRELRSSKWAMLIGVRCKKKM